MPSYNTKGKRDEYFDKQAWKNSIGIALLSKLTKDPFPMFINVLISNKTSMLSLNVIVQWKNTQPQRIEKQLL